MNWDLSSGEVSRAVIKTVFALDQSPAESPKHHNPARQQERCDHYYLKTKAICLQALTLREKTSKLDFGRYYLLERCMESPGYSQEGKQEQQGEK